MEHYKNITKCRVCGSKALQQVLKLEEQYIGTTFVKSNEDNPTSNIKVPLTLVLCERCKLVQLKETTNPELLYTNYFYRTSVNDTMRKDLKDVVDSSLKRVKVKKDDCVIDIGANDGTMLSMFPSCLKRVGVEPAKNIDWSGIDKSIKIVNDFLSKEALLEGTNGEKAKIVTTTAVFYDLDNPNEAVQAVRDILDKDGVFVIQVSDLLATVKDFNLYDICHEHLEYYSLESLTYLLEQNDLFVYDAETNFVNGGSLRVYAVHDGSREKIRTANYWKIIKDEREASITLKKTYDNFAYKINEMSKKVKGFIVDELEKGKKIIGLGASTKSSVLLQICNIDKNILPVISERSPIKIGLRMAGLDIPLISEQEARNMKPDIMIVFPYNFAKEINEREKEYLENGGKLFYILPYPYILDKNGEHIL